MASEPAEEGFDDEISLTSTDDDENDDELFVAKVLAERHVNGVPRCLIQWQDRPLAEATWEPRENLTDGLMSDWERAKVDQRNGLAPKFELQEWKDAITQRYESSLGRHHLRNIVRSRRGHSQTIRQTMDELRQTLSIYSNDEEEVDRPDPSSAAKDLPQSLPHNQASPHADQIAVIPDDSTVLIDDSPSPQEPMRGGLFGTPDETRTPSLTEKSSVNQPAKLKSAFRNAETAARGSVRFALPTSETSHRVLKRPSLSRQPSAARSTGYANVFIGGRTRKGRQTLSEVAANPEAIPKLLNSRLKRVIEKQCRDREGIKAPTRRPSGLISLDQSNSQVTPDEQQSANNSKDDDEADGRRRSPTKGVAHWEDEPMELDPSDSLFVTDQIPSLASDASDDEMTQPDSIDSEEQPGFQTISKTVQLGSDKQSVVTLSFGGIPQETGLSWAEQFCSDERIVFTHTCNSEDFLCQTGEYGNLKIVQLCEGTALSFTENDALRNLASNLRLGSLGLLCYSENFCVYLFFSDKSDGQSIQGGDIATLEYQIFKPVDSLGPLMPAPAPLLVVSDEGDQSSAFWSRPLDEVFGQKYEQLLPTYTGNAEKHNFFLIFPPRAEQEALLLTRWLRDNRSDCDVRGSYAGGQWSSFLKLTHGVIIFHEDTLWAIRKIPRLHDLLHGRRSHFMFWMFSRSLLPVHSLGSEGSLVHPLGDIHLHRVFDPGAAFLITPSFLVSEPEHAYSFLKWFWNNYVKTFDMSRPRKLVLCAKVDEWMNDLFLEQMMMRREHPITASEEELSTKGISDKAIECRRKTLKLFQQLITDAPSESTGNESTRSIILAPEAIDGNDEQSLVNWFGEWSTLNIDQYRRYTVIGCGWQTEARLSRTIQVPIYEDSVINNPDGPLSGLPSQPEPTAPPSAPRQLREDESSSIKSRLYDIVEVAKRGYSPVKVYLFPVAYSTPDVGFRLGDLKSRYNSYEQWFTYFWKSFDHIQKTWKPPHNSFTGLFYTFNEHQALSRSFNDVRRSPWVAVFRPVSPHVRPSRSSELFIWDTRYAGSIGRGKTFRYADLLEGQQRLIDYIREKTQYALPLEEVWVGGFGVNPNGTTALDATIRWLGGLSTKVRDWIPASAKEIAGRGWSPVTAERSSGDREGNGVRAREVDNIKGNPQPEDDASRRRRIFHPPQGHGQYKYTKCRNQLYHWARQFDHKPEGGLFEYTFRPTIDWYTEQCEEGRGFEHIKVMAWQDVFQSYKIEEFLQKRG
ncbi:hypothetical protein V8C42DRAFT_313733 [Trichoderma barbatum]